ncbi:hypothetical protein [Deinococcus sp.]|uniref:hypothetical protein n=1 Tax=Deinococcus sp. TaxID=47478 RepID=UPI0025DFF816|nr:hypothetical protein [Deinococcus sp.]
MDEKNEQRQNAALSGQGAFRQQVETLVAQGKLTPEEAADLLGEGGNAGVSAVDMEKVALNAAPEAAPFTPAATAPTPPASPEAPAVPSIPAIPGLPGVGSVINKLVDRFVKEVAPHAESDTPDDLRLEVSGYSLIVSTVPGLKVPQLGGETEGLHLRSGPKGWTVEREGGVSIRLGSVHRATLSVPFVPRYVKAEVSGGQLVLPDIGGALEAEVSGGNLRVGDVGHLKAEVSGGNLNAGSVAGNLHLEINGGNGTVAHSTTLIASVNGGLLSWSGLLSSGQHRLEINGGAATLNLEAGSSVQLSAEVTVGQLVSNFAVDKRGGLLNATYSGRLGSGAAGLSCQVAAGQVRLNAADVPSEVNHA